MDPSQTSSPRNAHVTDDATPASAAANVPASLDLDAILAQVEALTGKVVTETVAEAAAFAPEAGSSPATMERVDASTSATQETQPSAGVDFALLEREIASLLGGDSTSSNSAESGTGPSTSRQEPTPTPPVANDAFLPRPSDPMLQEIEQLLDDTNDAVLKQTHGNLDAALESVFDPQALAGQEEDVHRALIEAFGTSRRPTGSLSATVITNPAPKFDGVSRAVPPELQVHAPAEINAMTSDSPLNAPIAVADNSASEATDLRTEVAATEPPRAFEQIAATTTAREPTEYAGEKPFEAAFPSVSVPTPEAHQSSVTTSPVSAASQTNGEVVPIHKAQLRMNWWKPIAKRLLHAVLFVARAPIELASLPMRLIPSNARLYISAVALASVLSVPLAWWLAYSASSQPGIGRVQFASDTHANDEQHSSEVEASHDRATSDGKASTHGEDPKPTQSHGHTS